MQNANGHYATVNGLKMYYEVYGSGQPLVLLHGGFGFNEGWIPLLPALTEKHQVIAVELQGHGHTEDRKQPLTFEQMADDVAELLKQLEIKAADIFGYSMGGTVGLAVAIRHPEQVRKLAILGSCASSSKDACEPEVYAQMQNLSTDFAPPMLKEPYDRMAPDPLHWPILVQKVQHLIREYPGFSAAELQSIKAQTLIVQGDRDVVRPEHAVQTYRLIPDAQLAIVPGGDHFMLFYTPDKVLSLLTPFLDAPATSPEAHVGHPPK